MRPSRLVTLAQGDNTTSFGRYDKVGNVISSEVEKSQKMYYVYIITNKTNTVLYTGVTNNLQRRIYEHKNKLVDGFSKRYNLCKLVYFEETTDVYSAISREKQVKDWRREKKIALINMINPNWVDLSESLEL